MLREQGCVDRSKVVLAGGNLYNSCIGSLRSGDTNKIVHFRSVIEQLTSEILNHKNSTKVQIFCQLIQEKKGVKQETNKILNWSVRKVSAVVIVIIAKLKR